MGNNFLVCSLCGWRRRGVVYGCRKEVPVESTVRFRISPVTVSGRGYEFVPELDATAQCRKLSQSYRDGRVSRSGIEEGCRDSGIEIGGMGVREMIVALCAKYSLGGETSPEVGLSRRGDHASAWSLKLWDMVGVEGEGDELLGIDVAEELRGVLGVGRWAARQDGTEQDDIVVAARRMRDRLEELEARQDTAEDEDQDRTARAEVFMWVERGLSLRYAAAMARVSPERARWWVQREEFEGQFLQSRGRRMLRLQEMMAGARPGDWQRYATFLERQFSDEWCVRKVVDTSIEVNYVKTNEASETLAYVLSCVREESDAITFARVVERLARGSADKAKMGEMLKLASGKAQDVVDVEYRMEGEEEQQERQGRQALEREPIPEAEVPQEDTQTPEEELAQEPEGPFLYLDDAGEAEEEEELSQESEGEEDRREVVASGMKSQVRRGGAPRRLPPGEELLRLRETQTVREIAETYGCTVGGIRNAIARHLARDEREASS
jgi:hypothetical protein